MDRLRRFVGKPGVDDAMFCEIARLMAMRMSYQDPIRIAQLKLAELDGAGDPHAAPADDVRKFRLDELVEALPAAVARADPRCPRTLRMAAQADLDPLQHQEPAGAFAA